LGGRVLVNSNFVPTGIREKTGKEEERFRARHLREAEGNRRKRKIQGSTVARPGRFTWGTGPERGGG